jgi:hypothetical protein
MHMPQQQHEQIVSSEPQQTCSPPDQKPTRQKVLVQHTSHQGCTLDQILITYRCSNTLHTREQAVFV